MGLGLMDLASAVKVKIIRDKLLIRITFHNAFHSRLGFLTIGTPVTR